MLKITETTSGGSARTFKLEGKLLEPWLDEVLQVSLSAGPSATVRLDLSAVTFADAASVQLLRELARRGVVLVACSRFVAELLNREPQ